MRRWPLVPGIDFAGTVMVLKARRRKGDKVLLNGWGVGETHHGAYAGSARLKGDWLVPLPEGLTPDRQWPWAPQATRPCCASWRWSGTAWPQRTGGRHRRGGGVGGIAVILLSQLGYHVIASTGRWPRPIS